MKRQIILIFVLVAAFLAAGSDPNSSFIEDRVSALEERVYSLEQRIVQLEQGLSEPSSETITDINETDCDKAARQVQRLKNSAELIQHRIYSLSGIDAAGDNARGLIYKQYNLLTDLESTYLKMIHFAGKCSLSDPNIMDLKKALVECQVDKYNAEMKLKSLQDESPPPKQKTSEKNTAGVSDKNTKDRKHKRTSGIIQDTK